MPKKTFYNIPEIKQNKIIKAGVRLFSKYPFENVDVQTVVNEVGLPRGSFYAYFEDMEDYYKVVISSFKSERIKTVNKIAENFHGNLFDFLIELFKFDIAQYAQKEKKLLLAYYFRFLQTRKIGSLEETIYHPSQVIGIYKILESFDNGAGKEERSNKDKAFIIDFSMNIYLATYNVCVNDQMSEKDSIDLFTKRIKIIERGVL